MTNLLIIICLFTQSTVDTNTGIDILFNKRVYISDVTSECKFHYPCTKRPCVEKDCQKYYSIFQEYKNKGVNEWSKNEKLLWKNFFGLCKFPRRHHFKMIPGILPTDTILTKILIDALCYHDNEIRNWSYLTLFMGTPYSLLYQNSIYIQNRLECSTLPDTAKIKLLALSTQSDSTKERLLKSDLLPIFLRARLGDTLAEDMLFKQFYTDTAFKNREKTVYEIAMAGTKRSMAFLIENFNKPFFTKSDTCYTKSIRLSIIEGFQRHYPNIDLFNELWYKMKGLDFYTTDETQNPDSVKAYLDKVVAFFEKTCHAKPLDPEPFPTLTGSPNCWPVSKPIKK